MEIMEVTLIRILVQEMEEALDLLEAAKDNLAEAEIIKDKDLEEVLVDSKVTVFKTLMEEIIIALEGLEIIKMTVGLVDLEVMILIKDLEEDLVVVMVDLVVEMVVLEVVAEVLEGDLVVTLLVLEVVIEEEIEIEEDTMVQIISDNTKIYLW
jgi:hypothetical protein